MRQKVKVLVEYVLMFAFSQVQTEDQYIFIHDAILEAVNCGNTELPARNLFNHLHKLTSPDNGSNITGMELEFKVVEHLLKGAVFIAKYLTTVISCFLKPHYCSISFYISELHASRKMT